MNKRKRVHANELNGWKEDIANPYRGKDVTLICNQTNGGAYDSSPSRKLAEEYNAAKYWFDREEILRGFSDCGHGEGLTNLVALARLLAVGAEVKIEMRYV